MDIQTNRRRLLLAGTAVAAGLLGHRVHAQSAPQSARQSARHEVGSVVATASGRVRGLQQQGVQIFKGIPYAASTAGRNRFAAARPAEPWTGILNAFAYGPTAPQRPYRSRPLYASELPPPERGEDCLRLNVWTPSTQPGKRPVMVWWHGGGFEAGSGSSVRYDGVNLCRRGDVVVVTVNHRLNVFGHCFLANHLGADFAESGNVGFLDLVASLRWVRDNIDRFGGDPSNVTIFGQSGGGRKVSLALAAPAASGLFHRAIVQSGSHLRIQTPDQASEHTDRLLHHLNIPQGKADRLLNLPWERLTEAQLRVSADANLRFAPVIDGEVFDRHPWDPDAPAVSSKVPMLVGNTRTELSNQRGEDESIYAMPESELAARLEHYIPADDVAEVIEIFKRSNPGASPAHLFFLITTARGYVRDATLQLERRVRSDAAPAYRYLLTWHTPVQGGRRFSPHSLDVPLVFDNVDKAGSMVGPPTARAEAVATAMSESWIAFARTGDPNNPSVPRWRPYDLERRTTMLFDDQSTAVDDPNRDERLAMERYPSQQMVSGRALHRTERSQ